MWTVDSLYEEDELSDDGVGGDSEHVNEATKNQPGQSPRMSRFLAPFCATVPAEGAQEVCGELDVARRRHKTESVTKEHMRSEDRVENFAGTDRSAARVSTHPLQHPGHAEVVTTTASRNRARLPASEGRVCVRQTAVQVQATTRATTGDNVAYASPLQRVS